MSAKKAADLAKTLRRKRALLLVGSLADEVNFGGRTLLDYAADIAKKLDLPVAATGNTVVGLKEKGVTRTKKMWVGEVVDFLRYPWKDPIMEKKPDLAVFVGYSPAVAGNLTSMVTKVQTMVLGSTYVPQATYSLPDSSSLGQWQKSLEELVQALGV